MANASRQGFRAKGKQKKPWEPAKPAETSESGQALTLPPCPRVMGIDPGARTAWTVYTSDGFLIEVGVKEDAKTLSDLRVQAAEVHSQLTARKPWRNLNKGQRDRGLVHPYLIHGRGRARLRRKKARILARHFQLVQSLECTATGFNIPDGDSCKSFKCTATGFKIPDKNPQRTAFTGSRVFKGMASSITVSSFAASSSTAAEPSVPRTEVQLSVNQPSVPQAEVQNMHQRVSSFVAHNADVLSGQECKSR